ncbi:MAG: ATP-dependent DNA helicase [Candidatus Methanoplasma sp.]|jgi:DNA excision repair protein ERCC-2|nr:ATP-dependent DNA helicase [Candidatus Methanoplasma sp.]
MDLFPYGYRGSQREMASAVRSAAEEGRPLVMESGTGTGKTATSLAGALEAAPGLGAKVVFLTRTKSQQRQVVREAAEISERRPVSCLALQGRSARECPMMRGDREAEGGSPEELSQLCAELKAERGGRPGCEFYARISEEDIGAHAAFVEREHPGPEAFAEYCEAKGLCRYELAKLLLPRMDLIAAPYTFMFAPPVRRRFLEWAGCGMGDAILIADEAHNLPGYLREVMTFECGSRTLSLAAREAEEWGDPEAAEGIRVSDLAEAVAEALGSAVEEHVAEGAEDALIPRTLLQDELMGRLGVSSRALDAMRGRALAEGEAISAAKRAERRLPRSYVRALGGFLQGWHESDEDVCAFFAIGGDSPRFQCACLDPYEAAWPLREARSSISMSGTLAPLRAYSAELGLEGATEIAFPSPFPKENLRVVYADDVSTKFDELSVSPEAYWRLRERAVSVAGCTDRNAAVFFPSYSLMERFAADGAPEAIGKPFFMERRDMSQQDLMGEVSRFSSSDGGVLFAVTGGRVSEGMDFPGRAMELAVIVGIPYPKPTARQAALGRYCERRFGDGWAYSSGIPAARKMRQAIGRLIRSETDRGIAVILDRRAPSVAGIGAERVSDPCAAVTEFFGGAGRTG